ncbi:CBS domain-containing protein [Bacillus sp. N9]
MNMYKPETTGTLMKKEFIALQETYTVKEAIVHLRENVKGKRNIHYLYIVNSDRKPEGVLSIRELLSAANDELITDLMIKDVIAFPTDLDQEDAAQTFRERSRFHTCCQ